LLNAITTKQFEKDVKLARKRGKNLNKLHTVMQLLLGEEKLPHNYFDHNLTGNYIHRRECHVEPDWLLIYYKPNTVDIIFERTGTHSDLFK
jgi:mRNA interferase YafQ